VSADDSGSMVFEERGERIDDLKLILGRVAEVRKFSLYPCSNPFQLLKICVEHCQYKFSN